MNSCHGDIFMECIQAKSLMIPHFLTAIHKLSTLVATLRRLSLCVNDCLFSSPGLGDGGHLEGIGSSRNQSRDFDAVGCCTGLSTIFKLDQDTVRASPFNLSWIYYLKFWSRRRFMTGNSYILLFWAISPKKFLLKGKRFPTQERWWNWLTWQCEDLLPLEDLEK